MERKKEREREATHVIYIENNNIIQVVYSFIQFSELFDVSKHQPF